MNINVNMPSHLFLNTLETQLVHLQLPIGSYLIAGSGPLAIRNIRVADDIDVLVNENLWAQLQNQYPVSGPHNNRILIGSVEIWKDWPNVAATVDELIQDREIVESFPFMRLATVVEWKTHFGRPKDLVDINLIRAYLYNHL